METSLHGPMDDANTLKPCFCVGDLDVPERRNEHASSRVEEEDGVHGGAHVAAQTRTEPT